MLGYPRRGMPDGPSIGQRIFYGFVAVVIGFFGVIVALWLVSFFWPTTESDSRQASARPPTLSTPAPVAPPKPATPPAPAPVAPPKPTTPAAPAPATPAVTTPP